jgi:hypothetical protein
MNFRHYGWLAILFCVLTVTAVTAQTDEPSFVVQTAYGRLSGVERDGVIVLRGVPFAASPVGPLRFKPPQPLSGWTGIRDAIQNGPWCMQPHNPGSGHIRSPLDQGRLPNRVNLGPIRASTDELRVRSSGSCLQDHIEWSFGRPAHPPEAAFADDRRQLSKPSLCS